MLDQQTHGYSKLCLQFLSLRITRPPEDPRSFYGVRVSRTLVYEHILGEYTPIDREPDQRVRAEFWLQFSPKEKSGPSQL